MNGPREREKNRQKSKSPGISVCITRIDFFSVTLFLRTCLGKDEEEEEKRLINKEQLFSIKF